LEELGGASVEVTLGEDGITRLQNAQQQGGDSGHPAGGHHPGGGFVQAKRLQVGNFLANGIDGGVGITAVDMPGLDIAEKFDALLDDFKGEGGGGVNGQNVGWGGPVFRILFDTKGIDLHGWAVFGLASRFYSGRHGVVHGVFAPGVAAQDAEEG
jgi:hypothetical protein